MKINYALVVNKILHYPIVEERKKNQNHFSFSIKEISNSHTLLTRWEVDSHLSHLVTGITKQVDLLIHHVLINNGLIWIVIRWKNGWTS